MAATKFFKKTATLTKGGAEAQSIFTGGAKIRSLGLPTRDDGSIDLNSTNLTFEASYDGAHWFTLNDFTGTPLTISTRVTQKVVSNVGLDTAPAVLPIREPVLFEGIVMIRPVGNRPEDADRLIDFYHEISDL